jgi:hypothetical protein
VNEGDGNRGRIKKVGSENVMEMCCSQDLGTIRTTVKKVFKYATEQSGAI